MDVEKLFLGPRFPRPPLERGQAPSPDSTPSIGTSCLGSGAFGPSGLGPPQKNPVIAADSVPTTFWTKVIRPWPNAEVMQGPAILQYIQLALQQQCVPSNVDILGWSSICHREKNVRKPVPPTTIKPPLRLMNWRVILVLANNWSTELSLDSHHNIRLIYSCKL